MKKIVYRSAVLAVLVALCAFIIALADNTVADGDGVTPVADNILSLGTVCLNSTTVDTALVAVSRNGNYGSTNVFKKGSEVTISVKSVSGSGLSASMAANKITLPDDWNLVINNTMSAAVTSNITFTAGSLGAFSGSVTYQGTGVRDDDTTLTRDNTMTVTANVVDCTPAKLATTTTVTCDGGPFTYTGAAIEPCMAVVTASDGLNQTLPVTYANNTNAGTATASASFAGNDSYEPSSDSTTFTIDKADPTCSISGYTGDYDGEEHGATGACTGVLNETLAGLDLGATFKDVPGGTAHWAFTDGTGNYNDDSGSVAIVINKAATTTTVTCGTGPFTYTGAAITPCSAKVTGPGGLDETLTVTYEDNINAGTATASASYAESANYLASSDSTTFTIDKADTTTTVTCIAGPFTYTGSAIEPCTAKVTGPGGLDETLTVTYEDNINAGTATASASYAESANYLASSDSKTFTIHKALLTVTADDKTIIFGQPLPEFTFQYSGFVGGEDAGVIDTPPTCGVGSIQMYGSFPIVCSGGSDNNYDFDYVNGTLTVVKWNLLGFYQPVDMDKLNTVKGGSTVPLKFEVFAGSLELTDTSAVKSLQAYQVACTFEGNEDAIETVSTGGTSLRYDSTSGQFIFNWQTPKKPGACYKVTLTTLDGSTLSANFKLK
jgi:hypothetical protein